MGSPDYGRGNIACAKVVVQAMYRALGYDPIGVQLAVAPADIAYVWEREAKKFLVEQARRRHFGLPPLTPKQLIDLQAVPAAWDELAGERPGEGEHVAKKKDFYCNPDVPFSVVAK